MLLYLPVLLFPSPTLSPRHAHSHPVSTYQYCYPWGKGSPLLWVAVQSSGRRAPGWRCCAAQGSSPPLTSGAIPSPAGIWRRLVFSVGGPPLKIETICEDYHALVVADWRIGGDDVKSRRLLCIDSIGDLCLLQNSQVNVCLCHPAQRQLKATIV